jgi:cyclic-di-GMP phosphodiesterase TipF (flagellum assembly factor)
MRRLTLALLGATYLCLSLIVALTLWRGGGGWGAGVAALVGGLGLCVAVHALVERMLEASSLRAEIEAVREAHKIMLDSLERIDSRITEVGEAVTDDVMRRSEALGDEVRLLEDLVERMRLQLEEHDDAAFRAPAGLVVRPSAAILETVREALTENRIDLFLQPVVNLPQRRTVFYESFSRLRDESGRVMMPGEFLSVAEPSGLVTTIDNLLLFRCVQIVRRLAKQDRKVGIFCNISTASLADDSFFPQFLELLTANRDLAGALIFEIGQAAFDARGSVEARNMGKLADLGFRFSVDKVTELDLDLQDLARSDVKFLKISAQTLIDELIEVDGRQVLRALPDLAAEDFAALTRRYGVEVVAEKVESERQVVGILELDIAFGQGHLFGEPRAIRDAVLAESDPQPTELKPAPRRRTPRRA